MNGTSDRIAIRVWGGLRVVDAQGAPIEVASRKARACLALLARSDAGRLSRERLAGMLWGDRSDEQARANLRQLLYELKPLSHGGVLGFDRQAVWLTPDRDDETAVMARTASAQLAAMLPERGLVPLADLDGIGDEFDDWLAAERAAIETELRRFVQQRIEDALAAGDATGARALSDAWMRHDACDETMARLGLRADAALGDRAGMQQRQRRLELALAAELGVKPAATTSTLARDLDGALTQAIADPASRDRAGPMSRTGDVDVAPARRSPRMARVAVVAIVVLSLVFGYAAWRAMAHAPTAARQEAVALAARAHALTHGRDSRVLAGGGARAARHHARSRLRAGLGRTRGGDLVARLDGAARSGRSRVGRISRRRRALRRARSVSTRIRPAHWRCAG
jgi:DNA-binding SARP family transcriptional activator